MDDDSTKEKDQASTSKKESQRVNSDRNLNDKREHNEGTSNSESSGSAAHSTSGKGLTDARLHVTKKPTGKREQREKPERKIKRRHAGRVEKRRRSAPRRRAVKRAPKSKRRGKANGIVRASSISTVFTGLSSGSVSSVAACLRCGHRCCRRRFEYEMRCELRRKRRTRKIRRVKKKRQVKRVTIEHSGSACIQAGSRSTMLSPLFIKMNSLAAEETDQNENVAYCEVTPEIIYETLRRLTMWRQYVTTSSITNYIKRNYPVNAVESELLLELTEKLRIAAIVGIVTQVKDDFWCISCGLQNRNLTSNHVSLFWRIYGDTMKPVTGRKVDVTNRKESEERKTNTDMKICDDLNDLI